MGPPAYGQCRRVLVAMLLFAVSQARRADLDKSDRWSSSPTRRELRCPIFNWIVADKAPGNSLEILRHPANGRVHRVWESRGAKSGACRLLGARASLLFSSSPT